MWNRSISLPSGKMESQDGEGFAVDTAYEYIRGIPASFMDVTRDDEILASQKGYTADQTITIMACNYNGAEFVVDESDGSIYDIKRTFRKDKSMLLSLTCQRRERGGI